MKRAREADLELSAETQAMLTKMTDLCESFIRDYSVVGIALELNEPEMDESESESQNNSIEDDDTRLPVVEHWSYDDFYQ